MHAVKIVKQATMATETDKNFIGMLLTKARIGPSTDPGNRETREYGDAFQFSRSWTLVTPWMHPVHRGHPTENNLGCRPEHRDEDLCPRKETTIRSRAIRRLADWCPPPHPPVSLANEGSAPFARGVE